MPVTYLVVIAFDRNVEGDLKPGEAREVLSPIIAERRARALALEHAGALAFSRTGDPTTGEFQDAVILAQFGEVDLFRLANESASRRFSLVETGRYRVVDRQFESQKACDR